MTDRLVNVCIEGTIRAFIFFHFVQDVVGVKKIVNNLYWNIESLNSLATRKGQEYIF